MENLKESPSDVAGASMHPIVIPSVPFRPYYQDALITIYNADCRQVLPFLPKFDLLLTDPPFGINRDKGFGVGGTGKNGAPRQCVKRYKGRWDSERPSRSAIEAAVDAADKRIIWGGQFFADVLPVRGKWLWWDKQQTMPSYGDGELAWTDLSGDATKKFTLGMNGIIARGETGLHPTQKPVALMRWCLSLVEDAKTVLDPFAGSGTTGVACKLEGRKATLIEISEEYCEKAAKRLSQGVLF